MHYDMPLFRPPSEAYSFILQVTLGCSHNRCTFCGMYRQKRFRPVSPDAIQKNIAAAKALLGEELPRIFLADGDALCLSTSRLLPILDPLNEAFPRLQRISIYANARDILSKTDEELRELQRRKLTLIYLGLESGDEQTLQDVQKGATAEEMIEAVRRAKEAGILSSVMVLIGLAGKERSLLHARASAEAINRMAPSYTALLTFTPVPGTPLGDEIAAGKRAMLSPQESLLEIRQFIEHLDCRTYFSCNHASNYLPLKGKLPSAKERLLQLIEQGLNGALQLKPEYLRGL
jgi:radical SAM superfamily enzyme YgiQ (UPF0313 family)